MYVWDERDAHGEDAYIDDFASGDGTAEARSRPAVARSATAC